MEDGEKNHAHQWGQKTYGIRDCRMEQGKTLDLGIVD